EKRTWSEGDKRALESAAAIVSELIKSTPSGGNRLRVESAYLGLSEALQRLRTADEVREAVVEVLGHALGASRAVIVELSDAHAPEPVKHEYHQPSVKSALGVTFGAALFERATDSSMGESTAIANSREHSLVGSETAEQLGILSELAVPVRI